MDCKQVNKNITKFIDNSLQERELKEFIDHINRCPACKEELSIQFLVTEGLSRLETSSSFDIQGKLEERLKKGTSMSRMRKNLVIIMYAIEVIAFIIIIVMMIILILR